MVTLSPWGCTDKAGASSPALEKLALRPRPLRCCWRAVHSALPQLAETVYAVSPRRKKAMNGTVGALAAG